MASGAIVESSVAHAYEISSPETKWANERWKSSAEAGMSLKGASVLTRSTPVTSSIEKINFIGHRHLIDRLLVYSARMKRNLESTGGLIFSGQLLLDLAEAGMMREDAYKLVQTHAMKAWKEDLVFRDEVANDPAITGLLTAEKLDRTFDYTRQLGNVNAIFKRVLGE